MISPKDALTPMHMQAFAKNADERVLPDFSLPELRLLHKKYPRVTEELILRLFSVWRGVPRMVLRRVERHAISDQAALMKAIQSCTV